MIDMNQTYGCIGLFYVHLHVTGLHQFSSQTLSLWSSAAIKAQTVVLCWCLMKDVTWMAAYIAVPPRCGARVSCVCPLHLGSSDMSFNLHEWMW